MHARVTRYVRVCVRATHEYTRVHTGNDRPEGNDRNG